jgi:hypothetical protein
MGNQPLPWVVAAGLTCMPANEVAFGFRCTRRTSLLELTTTRLAEGLGADGLEALVTMVRDEIERSSNLPVNICALKTSHGIVAVRISGYVARSLDPFLSLSSCQRCGTPQ